MSAQLIAHVVDRHGTYRVFDVNRIHAAVLKAFTAVAGVEKLPYPQLHEIWQLTHAVVTRLESNNLPTTTVEVIQDTVESVLMAAQQVEVARRYVLYREEHRKRRATDPAIHVEGLDNVLERMVDPLLASGVERFVLFPIAHQDLWEAYKSHFALMWTVEELDLSKDPQDWNRLSDGERHFLSTVLAFFAASDGIVNENLAARFYKEVSAPEARAFYSMQMLIETVHSETYSQLIDTYVTDSAERQRLFQAVQTMPVVEAKARWALKWLDSSRPLAERLIAFACVEGIFFSSSFCAIYWIKDMKSGQLPGLCFSNELIARDEGLHTDFAILLHGKLQERTPADTIREIVREAVEIERQFVREALSSKLVGMNAAKMEQYVEFTAEQLLMKLGADGVYQVSNPFPFMERIGMQNKTNLHEKKVADYRRAGVGTPIAEQTVSFNADF